MDAVFSNPLAMMLGVVVAVYLAVGLRKHPRAALVIWLACIVLVPVWLEVRIGASLQPLSVLAVCLLPAVLLNWRGPFRLGDWLLVVFAGASTVAWLFYDTPQYAWAAVFTQWIAAYLVGRSLGPAAGGEWVTKALAVTGAIVGAWALIEYLLAWHLFEQFAVELDRSGWHGIQIRGSFARSEGAFGHSIAMGGFLALCVPFVIASKTTMPRRLLMLGLTVGGTFVTFSRGAIIGVAAAIVLSLLFLTAGVLSKGARAWLIVLTVAAAAVVIPTTLSLFDSVSSDLSASTDYRQNLAISFLPDLHPLGIGDGIQFTDNGRQFYRQFGSIDNEYALLGLQFGWVPLVILCVGVVAVVVRLIRRRGGPADVAIASQAVVLFTVALITQYGLAVFFVAGLAVGLGSANSSEAALKLRSTNEARYARL